MDDSAGKRPVRGSRTKSLVETSPGDERDTELGVEKWIFVGLMVGWQIFMLVIYAVWMEVHHVDEVTPLNLVDDDVSVFYSFFSDVNVMIFFGFGLLMTFLRRYGYSAIGYTLLLSACVAEWSYILDCFSESQEDEFEEITTDARCPITMFRMLNGLFAAATVMISYGAILGKATPSQLVVMAILEPMFFWLNIYITIFPSQLGALDIGGGMVIHTFGAYFGLAVTWFLTNSNTKGHEDNTSCYSSDIFSLLGTLLLWIYWPSFNAAIAPVGQQRLNAIVHTFLSLVGSTFISFVLSRVLTGKFDVVHIQNSTLAGGVMMGVAANLDITPGGAIGCGIIGGAVSVLGYVKLSPILNNYLGIQDICGVHNLHGMPGILGSLLAVFVTISSDQAEKYDFPEGENQPGYQMAALVVSIVLAIVGGIITGGVMKLLDFTHHVNAIDFFNDRLWWSNPSDYEHVIRGSDAAEH
mmetsp:Transcript_33992/g.95693  ORF Transcript_33992/g.95693 Transcript_33992/m.95693 type:complete len:468 (-) Transcript_33992:61-1464(-)|eukprot:CAMPEP_0119123920 /NCGR_PEP_ID=MMETSP1310-20130426/3696_1 /TAXON_ID=464262 /ORGANISM="Genus nov. species nov., Strain RCC2339" /LENGTH=467 /DNA_ID=CAMNT_0007113793 /DNA_START=126 /DNA_END=1529 /DNA_ORIENTATION=+